ncbi:MAG TPA: SIMPL domain-containing protein [Kofleriaceae bacterium]|nr:SIMPL domain-containing protein [Kofleriaceae bacterium]
MIRKEDDRPGVPRWLDLRPIGTVALAIAMVWSVAIAAGSWRTVRGRPPEQRTIKVTGSAKKRIASDLIEWEAVIEARATDRTAAYKMMREHRDKAIEFLKAQGVKETEISPQSTTFEEEFDTVEELKAVAGAKEPVKIEKKVFKGYVTREAILVRSSDVPRIEKASREITSLLEQGISITSNAPAYFYTRLGELKVEMLAAAGKDARARADNILKSAGGSAIKRLRKTNMGIININPANSTQTSEEGNNDRTSYEKDIITIVHAEFELED